MAKRASQLVTLRIDVEGATELKGALLDTASANRMHQDALVEVVDLLVRKAKALAPVKTGKLQKSIRGQIRADKNYGWVQPYAKHAHLVEFGTKGHFIGPGKARKRGRVRVAVGVKGEWARRKVWHPGSKKHAFLWPAVDATKGDVQRILEKHGEEYIVRVTRAAASKYRARRPA
jgi:HK97 gp10 family phage protein